MYSRSRLRLSLMQIAPIAPVGLGLVKDRDLARLECDSRDVPHVKFSPHSTEIRRIAAIVCDV